MARRSVVIRLKRPPKTPRDWDGQTLGLIRECRQAILADVRWHLEAKKPRALEEIDTWGPWCLGVLNRCADPDTLLEHIKNQRRGIDADKEEIALVLDHLRGCMISYFKNCAVKLGNVDRSIIWAPTAWLVQALRAFDSAMGERTAQLYLPRLAATGRLRKHDTNTQRGYRWVGPAVDLEDPPAERAIAYRPDNPMLRQLR
jgi:hypothetical protein